MGVVRRTPLRAPTVVNSSVGSPVSSPTNDRRPPEARINGRSRWCRNKASAAETAGTAAPRCMRICQRAGAGASLERDSVMTYNCSGRHCERNLRSNLSLQQKIASSQSTLLAMTWAEQLRSWLVYPGRQEGGGTRAWTPLIAFNDTPDHFRIRGEF